MQHHLNTGWNTEMIVSFKLECTHTISSYTPYIAISVTVYIHCHSRWWRTHLSYSWTQCACLHACKRVHTLDGWGMFRHLSDGSTSQAACFSAIACQDNRLGSHRVTPGRTPSFSTCLHPCCTPSGLSMSPQGCWLTCYTQFGSHKSHSSGPVWWRFRTLFKLYEKATSCNAVS